MKATGWWTFVIFIVWFVAKPGGGEILIGIALCVVLPFWLVKKFFDHAEAQREIVLDDFADRLTRANARRLRHED